MSVEHASFMDLAMPLPKRGRRDNLTSFSSCSTCKPSPVFPAASMFAKRPSTELSGLSPAAGAGILMGLALLGGITQLFVTAYFAKKKHSIGWGVGTGLATGLALGALGAGVAASTDAPPPGMTV